MNCTFCKNEIKGKDFKGYCQSCYRYLFIECKDIYPIPNDGRISYNEDGDVICHECGMAFRKLGNHIYNKHDMSINDYKDKHKLYHNEKLTNISYQEKMREYNNFYYNDVVFKNLIKNGNNTRFKLGQVTEGAGKHIKEKMNWYEN